MVASVTYGAVFTLDTAGTINSWNRTADKIDGYSAANIIGQHYSILFTEEDRQQGIPQTELDLAIRNRSADKTRFLVRQNGHHYWAEGFSHRHSRHYRHTDRVHQNHWAYNSSQAYSGRATKDAGRTSHCLACSAGGYLNWEIDSKETFDDNLRNLFSIQPEDEVNTIEDFYARIHPDDRANL